MFAASHTQLESVTGSEPQESLWTSSTTAHTAGLASQNLLPISEFHKTLFCMFFKPFVLQGHRKCPHKPCLHCSTHVIHICVLVNIYTRHIQTSTRTDTRRTPTRTHTHTHTRRHKTYTYAHPHKTHTHTHTHPHPHTHWFLWFYGDSS